MAEELIISISGMRGIIGENLYPQTAVEYACAFGSFIRSRSKNIPKPKVCIGTDSRPSGSMIKSAVIAGLTATGIDVIDLGIVTTPGVGIMTTSMGCQGGVIITASHNPVKYNGIKFLLDEGIAPSKDLAQQILSIYLEKKWHLVDSINCGKLSSSDHTDDLHIEKVLGIVDAKLIISKKFKVVLDSVNGAGGRAGKKLLDQLGCDVVTVNYEPTGIFAHTPEPTKENLTDLCKIVKDNNADIGFAQDPDADRLALVDEKGSYIGEEYTLALAAQCVFADNPGTAAANLSTSRMIDDIAAKFNTRVFRTPVGEANVAQAMKKNNCVIGGEGNGGIIDLRVGPVRDSLVGMALVLQLLAKNNSSLSQQVATIPAYAMIKEKFPADEKLAKDIIDQAKKIFQNAKINESDGCRFDFENAWLHLRTSNTEPVMRAIAEAPTDSQAQEYLKKIDDIRNEIEG